MSNYIAALPRELQKIIVALVDNCRAQSRLACCSRELRELVYNDSVYQFKKRLFEPFNIGSLAGAVMLGSLELVEICVAKGYRNWNEGLCCAAQFGQPHLVDFFIKHGADNWEGALDAAGGSWEWGIPAHPKLQEFFKSKLGISSATR